jgi:hypothetical protein
MALIIFAKLLCIAWYIPVNLSNLLFIPILTENVGEIIQDIYWILLVLYPSSGQINQLNTKIRPCKKYEHLV